MGFDTIKIECEDKMMEAHASNLNLVYKSPDMGMKELKYPDRLEIDSRAAMYHMEGVSKFHACTLLIMAHIFCDQEIRKMSADEIRKQGFGSMNICGMIDLYLKMTDMGVPTVLKYPETGLHPSAIQRVADILILMMNGPVVDWYSIDPEYNGEMDAENR